MDLRSRVIEAALSDGSIRQAARCFGVGITTATRWVRRWRGLPVGKASHGAPAWIPTGTTCLPW
ncbi:helix-turn-helix domain-containing protein [Azotobacter beijerinckii]|uniref:helix-turn-helix domain-containing protein n=1 Tax=Azotobacter beijerinckii TaxID=170623 RepID=UPI00349E6F04